MKLAPALSIRSARNDTRRAKHLYICASLQVDLSSFSLGERASPA